MCAVCKNEIVRRFGKRLTCAQRGCVDLLLPLVNLNGKKVIPHFKVESLMNHLCQLVSDHAETQKESCKLGQDEIVMGLVRECQQDNTEIEVISVDAVYERAMDRHDVDIYP